MLAAVATALTRAKGHRLATGRPLVTLSYAQSLDGCLAARPGQRLRLSGPATLRLTHELRAAHQAILVGIGTVLTDDPRLTVRLVEGPDPQPVILDGKLRFPLNAALLKSNSRQPWIMTLGDADPARQAALVGAGARVVSLPGGPGGISLPALLHYLGAQGIDSLMIEGGSRVITSFLAARLVDQCVLTIAPVFIGGLRAIGDPSPQTIGRPRLRAATFHSLDGDLVIHGALAWPSARSTSQS